MVSPESVLRGVVWNQPKNEADYVARSGLIYDSYFHERNKQLMTMASRLPEELGMRKPRDFDTATSVIFATPDTAREVLDKLGVRNYGDITSSDTALFQAGMHALIGITALRTSRKPAQYVATTLSRGNVRTPIGKANMDEMSNLTYISNSLANGLREDCRNKVTAVKPIHQGIARVKEQDYPYFISPFSTLGELHVYFDDIGTTDVVPVVRYPVLFNKEMRATNRTQDMHIDQLNRALELGDQVSIQREMRYLGNNLRSLFMAQLAIYFAAGQRFPNNFFLQAGDLMGKLYPNGNIDTALITCRGGLSKRTDYHEFIRTRTKNSLNGVSDSTSTDESIQGSIFEGFQDPLVSISVLNETLGMFREDQANAYRKHIYTKKRRR